MTQAFDIIVAGGGMVGAALATGSDRAVLPWPWSTGRAAADS